MLTQELVRELLDYNPYTGIFTHKKRDARHFDSQRRADHWNGRFAGDRACIINRYSGYRFITINNNRYRAHRVAWLYMTGEMPNDQVDHINGKRSDNRWINLRAATNSVNGKNQKKRCTNKS